jgi:hypothetical protein
LWRCSERSHALRAKSPRKSANARAGQASPEIE